MRDASAYSVAAMVLVAGVLAACETVPYTGRSQLQLMSAQQEGQMGVQTFQDMSLPAIPPRCKPSSPARGRESPPNSPRLTPRSPLA